MQFSLVLSKLKNLLYFFKKFSLSIPVNFQFEKHSYHQRNNTIVKHSQKWITNKLPKSFLKIYQLTMNCIQCNIYDSSSSTSFISVNIPVQCVFHFVLFLVVCSFYFCVLCRLHGSHPSTSEWCEFPLVALSVFVFRFVQWGIALLNCCSRTMGHV